MKLKRRKRQIVVKKKKMHTWMRKILKKVIIIKVWMQLSFEGEIKDWDWNETHVEFSGVFDKILFQSLSLKH